MRAENREMDKRSVRPSNATVKIGFAIFEGLSSYAIQLATNPIAVTRSRFRNLNWIKR